jgi:hypothetical protein
MALKSQREVLLRDWKQFLADGCRMPGAARKQGDRTVSRMVLQPSSC